MSTEIMLPNCTDTFKESFHCLHKESWLHSLRLIGATGTWLLLWRYMSSLWDSGAVDNLSALFNSFKSNAFSHVSTTGVGNKYYT